MLLSRVVRQKISHCHLEAVSSFLALRIRIVGHNAGEDFDINVTFPDEYQVKELAGAPAVFKIKLKSISKKVMPELDDDMVKDSTEFDTVDEYKADVKKKLEEANEKHADSEVEAKIFDKVIENMTAGDPTGYV